MLPKRIEIEFTNNCNSKCLYCPRNYINNIGDGYMNLKLYKKIIDEVKGFPKITLQLHRRGESLLHPDFIKMISYLKKENFYDLQLATNAILLDKEKSELLSKVLTFISFSIDHPIIYKKNRGVDCYNIVEENINKFIKINNGKVKTQVSIVKTDEIKDEIINEFIDKWKSRVDRVRIYEEHSKDGKFGSLNKNRDSRVPCAKPNTDMVVFWNGKVVRCNHDWDGQALGDLNNNTIAKVFNNNKYDDLRNQNKLLKYKDEPCKSCDSWYAEEGIQGTGNVYE